MGIRHLTTFITQTVNDGFIQVDIEREIEKWKR